MTFFENQQKARQKTTLLVFYFLLAVLLIVLSINFVFYLVAINTISPPPTPGEWMDDTWWVWISTFTLGIIGLGTLNTSFKLRGGGRAVAKIVGARRIMSDANNLDERKLINVVEEMSIASGTPVPELYVLDNEGGINAFVAGLRPAEAVLVVTQGTLENLSRDELQGVIAHEYSHILNGDMRINIRLMGVLAGILIISQVGRIMLRTGGRKKEGGGIAVIGVALFLIGLIGYFFGALIKAAVSRQREFLADASAVQFTRNPSGIAGALWKIKSHTMGSILNNKHSDDLSHFCFGAPVSSFFTSMMATHPPLDERIRAIDPKFVPPVSGVKSRDKEIKNAAEEQASGRINTGEAPRTVSFTGPAGINTSTEAIVRNVGDLSPAQIGFAAALLASVPGQLETAIHHPYGARQVILALLLEESSNENLENGLGMIARSETAEFADTVRTLLEPVRKLGTSARLPLLNIALPALREMQQEQRNRLLEIAETLVKSDRRYTVFEFAFLTILQEQLGEQSGNDIPVRFFSFRDVENEIGLLMSIMARVGSNDEKTINETYRNIMKQFSAETLEPLKKQDCKLESLIAALHKLNMASPLLKQSIIQACADCIVLDNRILDREAGMLQAISASLDCPMPPLAAG